MKQLLFAALCGVVMFGCSSDSSVSPTAPSAVAVEPLPAGSNVHELADTDRHLQTLQTLFREGSRQYLLEHPDDEDFNCTNVEEVRVRFSDPGFVDALDVGMFVKFIGIPVGEKSLRVWWDFENDAATYEDFVIGDGDVNPIDGTLFDIERILEHTYGPNEIGAKKVRVELIIDGETGNCSRNRDILIAPTSYDMLVTRGSMLNCVSGPFFPPSLLYGVSFVPAIPAGKTYTVRVKVTGVGVGPGSSAILFGGEPTFTDTVFASVPATPGAVADLTITTTIPHNRFHVTAGIFPANTSVTFRILGVEVPGRTVGLEGSLKATCP